VGRKRTYTDEDRERARVALDSHGGNLSAAARYAGIPRVTLLSWRDEWAAAAAVPVPVEHLPAAVEYIRQSKKGEVINAAWDLASAAFERAKAALPDASARDAATVAGIAIDKAQLLSGDATERTDHNIRAVLGILPADIRAEVLRLAQGEHNA
jgi:transposase-like protein